MSHEECVLRKEDFKLSWKNENHGKIYKALLEQDEESLNAVEPGTLSLSLSLSLFFFSLSLFLSLSQSRLAVKMKMAAACGGPTVENTVPLINTGTSTAGQTRGQRRTKRDSRFLSNHDLCRDRQKEMGAAVASSMGMAFRAARPQANPPPALVGRPMSSGGKTAWTDDGRRMGPMDAPTIPGRLIDPRKIENKSLFKTARLRIDIHQEGRFYL